MEPRPTSPHTLDTRRVARMIAGVSYLVVVVVAFWGERKFRAWWKRNYLLAAPVARVEKAEARYRRKGKAVAGVADLNRNLSSRS